MWRDGQDSRHGELPNGDQGGCLPCGEGQPIYGGGVGGGHRQGLPPFSQCKEGEGFGRKAGGSSVCEVGRCGNRPGELKDVGGKSRLSGLRLQYRPRKKSSRGGRTPLENGKDSIHFNRV